MDVGEQPAAQPLPARVAAALRTFPQEIQEANADLMPAQP